MIGGAVLAAVFFSRVLWLTGATIVYQRGPMWLRERSWRWRNSIVVMISGIRGVVTLAAVFLLPEETPNRGFLQFLAFLVIAVSLLGGLALPPIIRRLRLPPPNLEQEQMQRQLLMSEAQAAGLSRLDDEVTDEVEERVVNRLRVNATFLTEEAETEEPQNSFRLAEYTRLRHNMIAAERDAVRQARAEGRYEEYAVRAVLAAIDAEELALKATAPRVPPPDPRPDGARPADGTMPAAAATTGL
ncbi:cation:proton antiporter domain-containing protein [Naasia aerilata]|uniref:Cation/H+ exchanger transmembrane domain-containing protein n=1 Tax=Naasia aerilata TaxID=1162966 RepID=A0ABN6XQK6_9MICO|nr:cation:proton antiporter [Naasia aerilata]BDZ47294.1 hypothetical protein GCM10025866_32030 [Naasia aerilata]